MLQPGVVSSSVSEKSCFGGENDSSSDSDMDLDDMVSRSVQLLTGELLPVKDGNRSDGRLFLDTSKDESLGRSVAHSGAIERQDGEHSAPSDQKTKKPAVIETAFSLKVRADLTKDLYLAANPARAVKAAASGSVLTKEAEIMKQSVVTKDFEKQHCVPAAEESKRRLLKQRQIERSKTKGAGWFDMPATELSEEKKNDLLVLQMRRVLDPKRFYKNNDMKALPKYFQMAKVVEGPADFYNARIPKKQRKATIVDELLADADFRSYNKKKYIEINASKLRSKGAYKHAKRLKRRK